MEVVAVMLIDLGSSGQYSGEAWQHIEAQFGILCQCCVGDFQGICDISAHDITVTTVCTPVLG